MQEFPSKVLDAFDELKAKHEETLVLRRLGRHYYVYKTASRWDREAKKVMTKQEYLGRIIENGAFINRLESWVGRDLKRAVAIVQARGGQVTFPKKEEVGAPKTPELSDVEKKVLMILSMNARAPVSLIAKKTGLKSSTVITTIRNFEKRYGMEYLLEIDIRKLGFRPYLILAKFEGEPPPSDLLKKLVTEEPRIQFAAEMKGDYDLVMYWLDDIESLEISDKMWRFESSGALKDYNMRLDVTPFGHAYSFIPLRGEFIDNVLKEKTQERRGHNALPKQNELRARDFALIKELNSDSIKNFTNIDTKYKFGKGAARYSYLDLKERAIIMRPTVNITNLPIKYTGVIMLETVNGVELEESRYRLQEDIIEYGELLNRYTLVGNIGIASGAMLFISVFHGGEVDKAIAYLRKNVKGAHFRGAVITDVLIGHLCYRRFDNTFSHQYSTLVSQKKIKPKVIENYEAA